MKGPRSCAESQSFDFPLLSDGHILLSNSKIYDFDFIEFTTYQNVIWLDITMTDSLSVYVNEGSENHFDDDLSALLRQSLPSSFVENIMQRGEITVLHDIIHFFSLFIDEKLDRIIDQRVFE